ncbi:hypothetical protein Ancab_026082 [Ancistrocladus abbreviatus]
MFSGGLVEQSMGGSLEWLAAPCLVAGRDVVQVQVNQKLSVLKITLNPAKFAAAPSPSSSSQSLSKLKTLCIDDAEDLIALPEEHVQNLISLDIQDDILVNLYSLQSQFHYE